MILYRWLIAAIAISIRTQILLATSDERNWSSTLECSSSITNLKHPKRISRPRPNEDRIISYDTEDPVIIRVHGVLDGHGSSDASEYLSKNIGPRISHTIKQLAVASDSDTDVVKQAIERAVYELDHDICEKLGFKGGAAASFVVQLPPFAYVVNLGDSRTLVEVDGRLVYATKDHKPSDPDQTRHIINAGGFIRHRVKDVARLDGKLALSKAFGDCFLKYWGDPYNNKNRTYHPNGHLSVHPDIEILPLTDSRMVFLSATDGVLDVLSTELLVESLRSRSDDLSNLCQEIVLVSREYLRSTDDITVVISRALQ